jgi:copper resistance protein C
MKTRGLTSALAAVGVLFATMATSNSAEAHARLIASTPAASSVSAAPSLITLRFNEPIESKFSQVEIKGPNGAKQRAAANVSAQDRKVLTATLTTPLTPGAYTLSWRIVATDSHVMKGAYKFTVR